MLVRRNSSDVEWWRRVVNEEKILNGDSFYVEIWKLVIVMTRKTLSADWA